MPTGAETFLYVAFVKDGDEVVAAFAPRRAENRDHAVRAAEALSRTYAGAMAWRVEGGGISPADPAHILFSHGETGPVE